MLLLQYKSEQELSCRKQIARHLHKHCSHNLATSASGESRRYVVAIAFNRVAGGGIWLRQESLRHILASPAGYAPGTIAVNVT